MRLQNKYALIPGASRPIGRAVARKFAKEGAFLFLPYYDWPDSTREMEEAVFALEPGAYSPVLTSPLGYHIVYVIAREERDLAPWSRRIWSRQVLEDWLRRAWEQGRVEILVPGIEVHPALQP